MNSNNEIIIDYAIKREKELLCYFIFNYVDFMFLAHQAPANKCGWGYRMENRYDCK